MNDALYIEMSSFGSNSHACIGIDQQSHTLFIARIKGAKTRFYIRFLKIVSVIKIYSTLNLYLDFEYLYIYKFARRCKFVCLFVCLSVCLFVCSSFMQKLLTRFLPNFVHRCKIKAKVT